ncbi:MAG TPA: tRNA pseudouridine(55) synthase TruB [Bacteroidales bacterium]|nr:tRNA pseudouridine(55) synthase TruB [Bacteroidales bacterium]
MDKPLNIFEEGQVLSFNKPLYWTSFDLVNKVRNLLRTNFGLKKIKVGHAGTLDPLASGLMIICTGRATKKIDEFRDLDKEYVATFTIGKTTPSFDLETETDNEYPTDHIDEDLVRKVLAGFTGEQLQMPPMYSAKLLEGKRAYEFARQGVVKELNPVKVYFREIELVSCNIPEITVRLLCSKGTYIRSFARDLGIALGSGACLSALERTAIGRFNVKESFTIDSFQDYLKTINPDA